jgi:hypothetical protein
VVEFLVYSPGGEKLIKPCAGQSRIGGSVNDQQLKKDKARIMNSIEDHTLEDHKLWKLMTEVWEALSTFFEPAVDRFLMSNNLERGTLRLLLAVLTCEPETIMVADLLVRNPYTSAEKFQARLSKAAEQGYLLESEPGSFHLSSAGFKLTQGMIQTARAAMEKADPLPQDDSAKLAVLFDRLVDACLHTPPPPEPWSIRSSFKLMPAISPPMPFIEQALTCLWAYRDDAHLAAWQLAGVTATAFEMLSLLWRNEATSLEGVHELLDQRGHPREVYQLALKELFERNFVAGKESRLSVTEGGRLFRNQIEEETERYFLIPWKSLSVQEKTVMTGLLYRLREGLHSQVA